MTAESDLDLRLARAWSCLSYDTRLASCSGAGSHGTRAHSTGMILLTNQNYFGYLKGAHFMPSLFSPHFSTYANKHFQHMETNEDSPIFARPLSTLNHYHTYAQVPINLATGLLIQFFLSMSGIAPGMASPDLQVSRLEYMMLHNLGDEDSKAARYNSYSHSSAKLVDVRGTPDEPAAITCTGGMQRKG